VKFCYDRDGICYELVAPIVDDNPVETILASTNNILNHVANKSENYKDTIFFSEIQVAYHLIPQNRQLRLGVLSSLFSDAVKTHYRNN
jgi:hypothetical protein